MTAYARRRTRLLVRNAGILQQRSRAASSLCPWSPPPVTPPPEGEIAQSFGVQEHPPDRQGDTGESLGDRVNGMSIRCTPRAPRRAHKAYRPNQPTEPLVTFVPEFNPRRRRKTPEPTPGTRPPPEDPEGPPGDVEVPGTGTSAQALGSDRKPLPWSPRGQPTRPPPRG